MICVILEVIMELSLPLILANIINIGITNNDIKYIIIKIIIMLLILILGIIGSILGTYISTFISVDISTKLRKKIVNKSLNLDYKNIDHLNIGNIVTLTTNDISNIENVIFLILKVFIKVPIIIIGSIFMCLTLSLKLSLILLIIVPIIIIISYIFMKKSYPYFRITYEKIDSFNSKVRENINMIKLVKANNKEKYEINKFKVQNNELKNINIKALKILSLMMPLIIFIINITTILILIISKQQIKYGFEIGNITAFIEYISLLLSSIISVSMIFLLILESTVSMKRIKEILTKKEEIKNKGKILNRIKQIELKNVCFSYNKKYNLENINLIIKNKEKIAIVGESGSGKTTLINLLTRNYDITKGNVLINDIDIRKYNISSLRKEIRIINQKNNVFKNTIANNIKFNKKINIEKVLKITLSENIVNKKEKKLKYIIEQNGKNLSGGEKERIILCRSLLEDFSLLVLDDSLSALDLKTEEKIIKNILKEYKDKTIIFITNRIRTVKNFDKIVLISNGKIEKIGTHEELLDNQNYKKLYDIGEVI
ncbi:MAG: ABC transporter ATP-binding protein [Bacilli bacterium]|nr:ABC transporter ATP-binding protein [Bacilli bacterium]